MSWGRQSVLCGAIALLALLARADAAGETMLPEIAAALSDNQPRKAEQLASAALADPGLSGTDRGRLFLDRGLAREQLGEHGDALTDLTQAIETHVLPAGDQALALFERGMALDALGRLPDALADYDSVVRLSPGSAAALNNRANVYRRLGRLDEARRDYLAALAAGDREAEYPYYGLGEIAEAGGDADAARGFYAKAVAANPGYKLAADRLNALGQPREAASAANLRPPQDVAKETPAAPPKDESGPLTLKPPPAVPPDTPVATVPVHLHRPQASLERAVLRPAITGGRGSSLEVQLGSWRAESEAQDGWNRALKKAGGDLEGLTPHIVAVDLPGRGRYYRLRVAADGGAASLCAALEAKGQECLPVRD